MSELQSGESAAAPARRWRQLNSHQRRVLGVLGEKAKTTPDVYPMSLNGVVTGCNQKSNRQPTLNLEPDQVEDALDKLREFGAVTLVEGSGRVQKYRHHLYDWLEVDKVEVAVMIELLLRGPQTVGDLRARAARMEPIADQAELRDVLRSLKQKGLVLALTSEGRGQIVTHGLYPQRDLDEQRSEYGGRAVEGGDDASDDDSPLPTAKPAAGTALNAYSAMPARPVQGTPTTAAFSSGASTTSSTASNSAASGALSGEMVELRAQIAELRANMEDYAEKQRQLEIELARLKDALGG